MKAQVFQLKKLAASISFLAISCTSFKQTAQYVDVERFMGKWHVAAGRVSLLEDDAWNPTELYEMVPATNEIAITYQYYDGGPEGALETIQQKAWVVEPSTGATWLVSPFWPLKFGYLILALDEENYQWAAIGVPSQSYLWILSRKKGLEKRALEEILARVEKMGYDISGVLRSKTK